MKSVSVFLNAFDQSLLVYLKESYSTSCGLTVGLLISDLCFFVFISKGSIVLSCSGLTSGMTGFVTSIFCTDALGELCGGFISFCSRLAKPVQTVLD